MIHYIRADLRRVFRRIPRLIILPLLYVVVALLFADALYSGVKVNFLTIVLEHYVVAYIPLVIGLLELAIVLSDDFHAKAMLSAIGMGISRTKVVLVKLADMAILMLLDLLFFGIIIVATGGICNMGISSAVIGELALSLFVTWLKSVAYTSLVLILAFYSQNILFAILVHILLSSGLAQKGLNILLQLKGIAPLHLERFLLTTQANTFYTQLLLGSFNLGALIAIAVYLAAGVMVASYLFSKIELEF